MGPDVPAGHAAPDSLGNVTLQASYVRTLKEGVDTAKERERRKRRPGPLLLAGFCNPPKALGPLVPIFLQGLLQVGALQSVPELPQCQDLLPCMVCRHAAACFSTAMVERPAKRAAGQWPA